MNNKQMYNRGIISELGIGGKENWMEGEDDDMKSTEEVSSRRTEESKEQENSQIHKM